MVNERQLGWRDALASIEMAAGTEPAVTAQSHHHYVNAVDPKYRDYIEGRHEYIKVQSGLYVVLTDCRVLKEVRFSNITDRMAGLHFRFKGATENSIDGIMRFSRNEGNFYCENYPAGLRYDVLYPVGTHLVSVAIVFEASMLRDYFDLSDSDLPECFRGRAGVDPDHFAFEGFAMEPELRQMALDMLTCDLTGNLRNLYLRGKACACISSAMAIVARHDVEGALPVKLTEAEEEKLRGLRTYIVENLSVTPHIPSLARALAMNRNKLQYGFRHLFGQSVIGYWHREKMMKAREDILGTDKPIAEIAEFLGYDHHRSFTLAFKSHFGVSPISLRNARQEPRFGQVSDN